MINMQTFYRLPSNQRGMTTILMATVMIFTISMISIYAAQVGVMEQKISANHYRAKQAFEAAQAGIDIALNEIDFNSLNSLLNADPAKSSWTHSELIDVLTNTSNKQQLQNSSGVTVGEYRLAMSLTNGAGDTSLLDLTAYGFASDVVSPADDGSNANQTSTVRLYRTPTIAYMPQAAIVATQAVNVNNPNVTITNDQNDIMAAVWSGGNTNAASTTIDVTNSSGDSDPAGGIYENDAALAGLDPATTGDNGEALFQNFFKMNKNQLKQRATVVDCKSGCTQADLLDDSGNPLSGIVWVDTRNDNGTPNDFSDDTFNQLSIDTAFDLGSTNNPVILIVDGQLVMNHSSAKISGLVYTSQDLTMKDPANAGQFVGSVVSEKGVDINQNVSFTYDPTLSANLQNQQTFYTRVAGSWKDF